MRLLAIPLTALLLVGCARGDLPQEVIEGERVRYFHDADHPPCDQVVPRIDAFVDAIDARFGLELPADFRFAYYHLETAEEGDPRIPEICGGPVSACSNPTGVYSAEYAHLHEVLHATLEPSGGAPPVFNEGLAHLVDCGPHRFVGSDTSRDPPLEEVLTRAAWDARDGDLDGGLRQASASFARFLIELHGERAYGAFLRDSKRGDDEARVRENFRARFGGEIEPALAAWRASDLPLSRGARCIFTEDACDATAALGALGEAAVETEGSCLPEVVVVDAPPGAVLEVSTSSSELGLSATVAPCNRFEPDDPVIRRFFYDTPISAESDALFRTPIGPGRWAISLNPEHRRAPAPVSLALALRPAEDSGCEAAPAIALDGDNTAFTVAGDAAELARANVWRLRLTETTTIRRGTIGPARWRACADACPLEGCRSLGEGPLEAGDWRLTLELASTDAGQRVWGAVAVQP